MSSPLYDGTVEKQLGGQFMFRCLLTGQQTSRDGISEGRRFIVSFHLEPCLTQYLSVGSFVRGFSV